VLCCTRNAGRRDGRLIRRSTGGGDRLLVHGTFHFLASIGLKGRSSGPPGSGTRGRSGQCPRRTTCATKKMSAGPENMRGNGCSMAAPTQLRFQTTSNVPHQWNEGFARIAVICRGLRQFPFELELPQLTDAWHLRASCGGEICSSSAKSLRVPRLRLVAGILHDISKGTEMQNSRVRVLPPQPASPSPTRHI